MNRCVDGPSSPLFKALEIDGNSSLADLENVGISKEMSAVIGYAPRGECVSWGIPFNIKNVVVIKDSPITVPVNPIKSKWFVFLHTSDLRGPSNEFNKANKLVRGEGHLGETAANYVIIYQDNTEVATPIRRRFQLGMIQRRWGENTFEAVGHMKPNSVVPAQEKSTVWGWSQTRVNPNDALSWMNWLWAWENPHPEKTIVGIRFEPVSGVVIISGLTAGDVNSHPLRWRKRLKACVKHKSLSTEADACDKDQQIKMDMGQIISVTPRSIYPNEYWEETYNNQIPEISQEELLIEYTAHEEANFYLGDGEIYPVRQVENHQLRSVVQAVTPATQRVTIKAIEKATGKPVPVKLHVHGKAGEYLAPTDRHRILNPGWFEDYSVDILHNDRHACTYIPGTATIDLPIGQVYLEVSKGFEIQPIRKVVKITQETKEIVFEVDHVLHWRERGWVSADTHVHFLSPMSALLEGSAEGVNVINLLASQWGELMTNVGDFDGKTTWGSKEAGGEGEYLVRVGTENRQHVMGHISLLGYRGNIISPMTTGGPDESALGDPIETLLTEWAEQCKKQGGLVIVPHFPNPRAEHAASIVSGKVDALEMTSWANLYAGIDPYSLADWYRYLNCGYLVAAVGGTDKMDAATAVGTSRTYARLDQEELFTYDAWMKAVRRAETFVTYGPLLEFVVDGVPMGSQIAMSQSGGTLDVVWEVASATIPMSRVELIVNGEIRESVAVSEFHDSGSWSVKVTQSFWLALLVRGHYKDKPEIITAHSSPVMVNLEGSQMMAAADAITILEQIEGAIAYLETIGTRAEDKAYKRMRLRLTSIHRSMHNRMHQSGCFHNHTPATDHPEHH